MYNLPLGYVRQTPVPFDDTKGDHFKWQMEVYVEAGRLSEEMGATSITDIGCGSGAKLMHFFSRPGITGYDIPDTVAWLKKNHPHRGHWRVLDVLGPPVSADIIICADMIEHVVHPDLLLQYLHKSSWQYLVLSTPDRSLLVDVPQLGPPGNPSHAQEWSFAEFGPFVRSHFWGDEYKLVSHTISNAAQATQMLILERHV
jgi:hypothetical protein